MKRHCRTRNIAVPSQEPAQALRLAGLSLSENTQELPWRQGLKSWAVSSIKAFTSVLGSWSVASAQGFSPRVLCLLRDRSHSEPAALCSAELLSIPSHVAGGRHLAQGSSFQHAWPTENGPSSYSLVTGQTPKPHHEHLFSHSHDTHPGQSHASTECHTQAVMPLLVKCTCTHTDSHAGHKPLWMKCWEIMVTLTGSSFAWLGSGAHHGKNWHRQDGFLKIGLFRGR